MRREEIKNVKNDVRFSNIGNNINMHPSNNSRTNTTSLYYSPSNTKRTIHGLNSLICEYITDNINKRFRLTRDSISINDKYLGH